jgi:hypothetical protein
LEILKNKEKGTEGEYGNSGRKKGKKKRGEGGKKREKRKGKRKREGEEDFSKGNREEIGEGARGG